MQAVICPLASCVNPPAVPSSSAGAGAGSGRQVCHLADKKQTGDPVSKSARNPSSELPSLSTATPAATISRSLQINGDFWGVPQAIAHELGHNMFLGHSSAYNPDGSLDE